MQQHHSPAETALCTLSIAAGSALTYAVDTPTIKESSLLNTVLGTVYAKDADANAKLTYTLDNNAGGRFAIDTKTTHCSVLTGTPVSRSFTRF